MKILVANAGSSSLKYQLMDMEDESVICKGNCDRIGIDGHFAYKNKDGKELDIDCNFPTHTEAFAKIIETMTSDEYGVVSSMDEISAVGQRIVHGGEFFSQPTLVDDDVVEKIASISYMAPVHNPAACLSIKACKAVMPNTPQVTVFDTAFHQTIPEKAYIYPLPYEIYEKYNVRKYGFHGTSHRFVCASLAKSMGKDLKDLKIVSCHLGNGSSVTAIDGGKSVDTSMGFTPLDGLIMGTRCGNIDPSVVTFVMDKLNLTPAQMNDYMNKKSGFLGVSGVGSDNRDICAASEKGNHRASLTTDILTYEIKKLIGAYAAVMNGLDAVLFTGGIGENADVVRAKACENLDFLGIKIDEDKNKVRAKENIKISTPDSKVEVWIVPTNEELLIARDVLETISK